MTELINKPTYKGKDVENFAWWRLLKVSYILVWLLASLWALTIGYFGYGDYQRNTGENTSLTKLIESGSLETYRYECRLEQSRSGNPFLGTFGEESCVEKKFGYYLPYGFNYHDTNQLLIIYLLLALAPVIAVELVRLAGLYILGVKGSHSIIYYIARLLNDK